MTELWAHRAPRFRLGSAGGLDLWEVVLGTFRSGKPEIS
jgi:hypothetical protein